MRNKRTYAFQKQRIKKTKHKPVLEMLRALLHATGRPWGDTASEGKQLCSTALPFPATFCSENSVPTAVWVLPWPLKILLSAAS